MLIPNLASRYLPTDPNVGAAISDPNVGTGTVNSDPNRSGSSTLASVVGLSIVGTGYGTYLSTLHFF